MIEVIKNMVRPAANGHTVAEDTIGVLKRWLYLADPEAVEIVFATAAAIYLPGDPLWTLVVGASGGGKTELLSMFANSEDVVLLSKITPHTLLSGLSTVKPGEDLIYKLNDKLLIIKDLAPLLEMGSDDQKAVLSDLRDAYDGLIARAWGSGKPMATWEGRFGMLAAVTPAIDRQWTFFAELGERYIRVNLHTDAERQTHAALEQMGQEDEMRAELRAAGAKLLEDCASRAPGSQPAASRPFRESVGDLAHVTAVLRTPVIRDRQHEVVAMPEPEVGTRLGKQFLRLAQASAFLDHRKEPGDHAHDLLLRVASDAVRARRALVLGALLSGKSRQSEVIEATGIPNQSVKHELEDLRLLKVVTTSSDGVGWVMEPGFEAKLRSTGLADRFTRNVPPAAIS